MYYFLGKEKFPGKPAFLIQHSCNWARPCTSWGWVLTNKSCDYEKADKRADWESPMLWQELCFCDSRINEKSGSLYEFRSFETHIALLFHGWHPVWLSRSLQPSGQPLPPSTDNDRRQKLEVFHPVLFLRQIYTLATRWEISQAPSWQRGSFVVTSGGRHVRSSFTEWCSPVNNSVDFIISATLSLAWIKHSFE